MAVVNKKNIAQFQKLLLEWYSNYGRHFPWRNKRMTRYQLIIAETLLQRTRAETVAKFYKNFIKKYPNWISLANARRPALEKYLTPLGLYRLRSKRLIALGQEMVKRKGKLPQDRLELEAIPSIGQYIANSIELLIFKKASPLLDVNMARVLERYFGERKLADIRYDPYLQNLSFKIANHADSKGISWAILDFAALVCKVNPLCEMCPISSNCLYFKKFHGKKAS